MPNTEISKIVKNKLVALELVVHMYDELLIRGKLCELSSRVNEENTQVLLELSSITTNCKYFTMQQVLNF